MKKLFLVLLFLCIVGVWFSFTNEWDVANQDYTADEWEILELHNFVRGYIWLEELEIDSDLTDLALERCKYVYRTEKLTHWWHFNNLADEYIAEKDVNFVWENLGQFYFNNLSLMMAWIKSPTHLDNILFKEYRYIGIVDYWPYTCVSFST